MECRPVDVYRTCRSRGIANSARIAAAAIFCHSSDRSVTAARRRISRRAVYPVASQAENALCAALMAARQFFEDAAAQRLRSRRGRVVNGEGGTCTRRAMLALHKKESKRNVGHTGINRMWRQTRLILSSSMINSGTPIKKPKPPLGARGRPNLVCLYIPLGHYDHSNLIASA